MCPSLFLLHAISLGIFEPKIGSVFQVSELRARTEEDKCKDLQELARVSTQQDLRGVRPSCSSPSTTIPHKLRPICTDPTRKAFFRTRDLRLPYSLRRCFQLSASTSVNTRRIPENLYINGKLIKFSK